MTMYLRLFRQRNFALMTVADAVSVLGDQIGWVALLWFAMVTSDNAATMGLLALIFGLPGVLLGPFVGNVLDRISHKKVLITANLLLGFVFVTIPLLHQMHALPIIVLLALVLVAGCLTPFTNVGWMVLVPSLVAEDELGHANSIVETIWNSASMLGPLVSGVLIANFGATIAVLVDGISFWVAALLVFMLKKTETHEKSVTQQSFFAETWNGVKILLELKPVLWITLGAVCFNFAYGQLEVSLPLLTYHELGRNAMVLGSFWTAYFVGSLIGAALSGLMPRNRSGTTMALMAIGWGLSFLPLLWFQTLWITYMSLAIAGILFGGYPPLARTAVQRVVPKDFIGRILGIRGSIIALGMPLGEYVSGVFGHWFPASRVIGVTGVVVVTVGLFLLSLRNFRKI